MNCLLKKFGAVLAPVSLAEGLLDTLSERFYGNQDNQGVLLVSFRRLAVCRVFDVESGTFLC